MAWFSGGEASSGKLHTQGALVAATQGFHVGLQQWSDQNKEVKTPGPKAGHFKVTLNDGSVVPYFWYRFVDQPTMQNADLGEVEKNTTAGRGRKNPSGMDFGQGIHARACPWDPSLA